MSAPVCPDCGGDRLYVCRGAAYIPVFVECGKAGCHWTQAPDEDLVILAALETYRRNNPEPEAA